MGNSKVYRTLQTHVYISICGSKGVNIILQTKLVDETKEYYQLVADSTISGDTWEEFASNLRRHIDNSDQLNKEWEVICIVVLDFNSIQAIRCKGTREDETQQFVHSSDASRQQTKE